MKHLNICITPDSRVPFNNNAAFCVGTGRMGLALQQEYQEQLAMAQSECHFKHIRGHGLFSDDMGIYQYWRAWDGSDEHESYNFTYLDRVMDSYLAAGLRPFIELGFNNGQGEIFLFHNDDEQFRTDYEAFAAMLPEELKTRWTVKVQA